MSLKHWTENTYRSGIYQWVAILEKKTQKYERCNETNSCCTVGGEVLFRRKIAGVCGLDFESDVRWSCFSTVRFMLPNDTINFKISSTVKGLIYGTTVSIYRENTILLIEFNSLKIKFP
jgi:hypothetical protein